MGGAQEVQEVKKLFVELQQLGGNGNGVKREDIASLLSFYSNKIPQSSQYLDSIHVSERKDAIVPKSKNQKLYVNAIENYDIVFGVGPAGTGKTYLAMAKAVSYLLENKFKRIILTRPAVEAGESLGFLPGTLDEKIKPYLRPLYDALYDMLELDAIQRYFDRDVIEVAPLAYMRGRTLNDSFIVLDEAQNTTIEQMKMFLTRIGFNSKAVITGDITQIDMPNHKKSGQFHAKVILNHVQGIKTVEFSGVDVVRHPLVKKIIKAYAKKQKEDES